MNKYNLNNKTLSNTDRILLPNRILHCFSKFVALDIRKHIWNFGHQRT